MDRGDGGGGIVGCHLGEGVGRLGLAFAQQPVGIHVGAEPRQARGFLLHRRKGVDAALLALQPERAEGQEDHPLAVPRGRLADADRGAQVLVGALQPAGGVHRVAHGGVVVAERAAEIADDGGAGVHADAGRTQLHAELAALRQLIRNRYQESNLVTQSPAMRRVLLQLAQAAKGNACALLIGEPGTGRQHFARLLHQRSTAAALAFVPVDCRHTDASELKRLIKQMRDDRRDLEILRTGTLLLQNIPEAPRDVQERLAEWLHGRAPDEPPRVLATSEVPLAPLAAVDDGFHRELYLELSTLTIEFPSLRERTEDIAPIAQFFLEHRNREAAVQLTGFAADVLQQFQQYRWPGNLAELRSIVETAAFQARGPQIHLSDLPMVFRVGQDAFRVAPPPILSVEPLDEVLARTEREQIQLALEASRGNLSRAAEMLGLSRPKLYRRLESLGLMNAENSEPAGS